MFVPTGQVGVSVAGWGIAVDHVIADYVAGAAEQLVIEGATRGDTLLVEGQGALHHPAYSGVTLGLLHGCTPHVLVLCHLAGATHVDEWPDVPIPPLSELAQAYEAVAAPHAAGARGRDHAEHAPTSPTSATRASECARGRAGDRSRLRRPRALRCRAALDGRRRGAASHGERRARARPLSPAARPAHARDGHRQREPRLVLRPGASRGQRAGDGARARADRPGSRHHRRRRADRPARGGGRGRDRGRPDPAGRRRARGARRAALGRHLSRRGRGRRARRRRRARQRLHGLLRRGASGRRGPPRRRRWSARTTGARRARTRRAATASRSTRSRTSCAPASSRRSRPGSTRDSLLVDPCFGFGKDTESDLALLAALPRLRTLDAALLAACSHKEFTADATGLEEDDLRGTLAAAVLCARGGADVLRLHDVGEIVPVLRLADAVRADAGSA